MELKHNLTDIRNALSEVMDTPIANAIRSGAIGGLGILNPIVGVVAEVGNDLLSEYDGFKFSLLLKGLSSESNLEKRLNELYNYVNASPEKAIVVANLFRKTIISECPKVLRTLFMWVWFCREWGYVIVLKLIVASVLIVWALCIGS